jgi:4-hydroxy-3-polyprenylbenzoate decarboxylase
MSTRKMVVGISGASGAPYAQRLLEHLRVHAEQVPLQVSVVLSRTARQVWEHECRGSIGDFGFPVYEGRQYEAPFASGSAGYEAMVVVPASMSSVARIAHGISDDLLTRAADVMLKERRTLILVARETPYSEIHLKNMLAVTQAGAMVLPATPSFYGSPLTINELIDTVLSRVLDRLGIHNQAQRRWGSDISSAVSYDSEVAPGEQRHGRLSEPPEPVIGDTSRHTIRISRALLGQDRDLRLAGGGRGGVSVAGSGAGVSRDHERDQEEQEPDKPHDEVQEHSGW